MHSINSKMTIVAIFTAINFVFGIGIGIKLYASTSEDSSASNEAAIESNQLLDNQTEGQER